MIKISILGRIGSGKSYIANNFGYPVFNADHEVTKLYRKDKKVFQQLSKKLPKYISIFPIDKKEITKAILSNENNLKKIINIVHKEIRKKLKLFLKKNKNQKIVILDIPLLLENKLNSKDDILVFVDATTSNIEKNIIKRVNFNRKLYNKFKKIQFSALYKKNKSHFIIKNNFRKRDAKIEIKNFLSKLL
tara:strand:- start:116 stop:685 length:570 start_codon:yes stop_codon:yes gene_type:complete